MLAIVFDDRHHVAVGIPLRADFPTLRLEEGEAEGLVRIRFEDGESPFRRPHAGALAGDAGEYSRRENDREQAQDRGHVRAPRGWNRTTDTLAPEAPAVNARIRG
jgi:hypothetical protein